MCGLDAGSRPRAEEALDPFVPEAQEAPDHGQSAARGATRSNEKNLRGHLEAHQETRTKPMFLLLA
jgi:hypothetical protein